MPRPFATLYVVDAFTDVPFSGNPAAICVLHEPASEKWMQLVAREMNLSETAFLQPAEDGFSLRWFTPSTEVDLCGHATLASAHALWETGVLISGQPARFHTRSGLLVCRRSDEGIVMDFPVLPVAPCSNPPQLADILGSIPRAIVRTPHDLLVELENEQAVRSLRPDLTRLAQLPVRGVIVTAPADADTDFDFVSRFFAPAAGIPEDPVTGSAHCALAPYWNTKWNRTEFRAHQLSERGGVVHVRLRGDRVDLTGHAVLVSKVELFHGPADLPPEPIRGK